MSPGLNWRSPATLFAIGVGVTVVLAALVVLALLQTNGAKAVSDNAPLIAAVVALGGVGTAQMVSIALEDQRARETRRIEADRTQEARDLEERRTQEARRIEADRTQEAALKTYFELMGQLLRQGLRRSYTRERAELLEQGQEWTHEEQQLRSLANVQTTLILRELAPRRKWFLLQFLSASQLIEREAPIVDFRENDLRDVTLCEYLSIDRNRASIYLGAHADPSKYLSKDDLSTVLRSIDVYLDGFLDTLDDTRTSAVLAGNTLRGANMIRAFARSVDLHEADLGGAYLAEADLIDANLSRAYLREAWLMEAVLIAANLSMANLTQVDSYGAVLVKADLSDADLSEADLSDADLRRANLMEANLSGANLSGADLSDVIGLKEDQIGRAIGTGDTRLPEGLDRPTAWNKSIEEQRANLRATRLRQKPEDE